MKLSEFVKTEYGKSISECTNEELYYALLTLTKKMASGKQHGNSKKKLYYISAEFLIGKLLSNNLINLGIYDEVKEELAQNGKNICEIEEFEKEPSLGNGGLGRLAACFIDSIATLGLNGDGVGLNYHFGLFRQVFENNMQTTVPDPWLTKKSWLTKTDVTYDIKFKGMTVKSRMYDIDVIGYNNTSNKLHLFDVESVDESIVEDGINFNKEDIKKNLTLFLYPDDSDEAGTKAAMRAIPILKEAGLSTKVINMQPYKDPDEFIKALGAEAFQERIDNASNSFMYEIGVIEKKYDRSDPESSTEFEREVARKLTGFSQKLERDNYLNAVCRKFNIQMDGICGKLWKPKRNS